MTPGVRVDLRKVEGVFSVEWYRPKDGTMQIGDDIPGSDYRELTSPWRGEDFVLRLVRIATETPPPTPTLVPTPEPTEEPEATDQPSE